MAREVCLYLFFVIVFVKLSAQNLQEDVMNQVNNSSRTQSILPRKRRYAVFPSGSSLQLVFCLTVPSVAVGEIFTIGNTAALAWELPDKPEFIYDIIAYKKGKTTTAAPETTTLPHLHHDYDDADVQHYDHPSERFDKPLKYFPGSWTSHSSKYPGAVSGMKTYYNPFLISKPSTFSFSSINTMPNRDPYSTIHREPFSSYGSNRRTNYAGGNRYKSSSYHQPEKVQKVKPVTTYLHPALHQFHRRTRRDLYEKIELLFTALRKDGTACLLKAICEVSKVAQGKGTFMEEIMKVIFRVKPHDEYPDEDQYDEAANKSHNCSERYPTCEGSIWSSMLNF